jgi:polyisoprenoid-binding protein YceI
MKIFLVLILLTSSFFNQEIKLITSESKLIIEGTSTIHDWESVVETYSITGSIQNKNLTDVNVVVKSKSIKSGKSIMDDKTYDALKEDQFPEIIFKAKTLSINENKIAGFGTLEIAGVSKQKELEAIITNQTATELKVKGTVAIKMSEFGIEPPTAMFGSITTGDEIFITYELKFKK